ncbi:MFS transporter [uncultured Friedmanniella sp.]|uniref:MFS transporter n=1 Tax=uncultured Friedmanniella sp. TaxID=335381 RepID=UPI0035CB1C1A
MSATTTPDRAKSGFLRRMTLACAWGEGVDGFDLGVVSVTLPFIAAALHTTPVQTGLIGASSLIGIFFGSPLAGFLTDRYGRRLMFSIDLVLFVVLGALQAVVTEPWQLLAVRILLGVTIGAEYAIGAAMLAEFAPARGRGRRLSALLVSWYVGYLAAVVLSYLLISAAGLSWRWVLVTSAVPALVTMVLRVGMPESPRWLISRGRADLAEQIVDDRLGAGYYAREQFGAESRADGGLRALLRGSNRRRLIFICVFWACNVAPYFAIFTFAPTVLESLRLSNPAAGTIALNATAALGALVGMLTIERVGRRVQLIPSFWVMAVALALIGLWSGAPSVLIVLAFGVFSFFNALQGNLTAVYPIEILPTEVRSSGVGVSAAFSRVAAAAGTFLLPLGITSLGTGPCMLIAAAVCVVGGVVSQVMAPETTGRALHETSRAALVPAAA